MSILLFFVVVCTFYEYASFSIAKRQCPVFSTGVCRELSAQAVESFMAFWLASLTQPPVCWKNVLLGLINNR